MFLIFEGLDKSGKSSLANIILKKSKYKYIAVNRGPAGYYAFDIIYGRETKDCFSEYDLDFKTLSSNNNYLVIYCKCSWEVAKKRLNDFNEMDLQDYHYSSAQKIYDYYIKRIYPKNRVLILDTEKQSINECTNLIFNKIEELKNKEKVEV